MFSIYLYSSHLIITNYGSGWGQTDMICAFLEFLCLALKLLSLSKYFIHAVNEILYWEAEVHWTIIIRRRWREGRREKKKIPGNKRNVNTNNKSKRNPVSSSRKIHSDPWIHCTTFISLSHTSLMGTKEGERAGESRFGSSCRCLLFREFPPDTNICPGNWDLRQPQRKHRRGCPFTVKRHVQAPCPVLHPLIRFLQAMLSLLTLVTQCRGW